MTESESYQKCWFRLLNNQFKVNCADIPEWKLSTDKCVNCGYSIVALSYQQHHCGSRYCSDCYNKLKSKYYCSICKKEDLNNFVHKKEDIFADKALKKDFEKISIKCPDCKSDINLLTLEEHALRNCNKGWILCDKCPGMVNKNVLHVCLNPVDKPKMQTSPYELCSECGKECRGNEEHNCMANWRNSCPYGCEIDSEDIETHRNECRLDHLDKVWALMKEKKMTECKLNEDSVQYVTWFESTVEKLRIALNYDMNDLPALRTEISLLRAEMESEKHVYEEIKSNLLNQFSNMHNTNFDGTIIWRIDNFNELREKAIEGLQKSILSPPFYTSKFGYKLCLRLYPNGDSRSKGVSMSLFVIIMLGDYDAMLRWPFKEKITFIMIDPKLKNHHTDEFQPSESMISFMKPKIEMNVPAGISNFIKLDKINDFVKNNSIFIKCVVDCSNLLE